MITARYVTYIAAPRIKVWKALTDGAITPGYFFGRRIESDWKIGSPWKMWMPDPLAQGSGAPEIVDSEGEVLEVVPGRRLVFTWRVMWLPEMRSLSEGRVSYMLDECGPGVIRLKMEQSHDTPPPQQYLDMGQQGWEAILSGLKTLLESGKPLPPISFS